MDQSYENENRINDNETYENFINDVIMEEMKKGLKLILMYKLKQIKIQNLKKIMKNQPKEVACSKKIVKTT
jgi:hypothetical protein